MAGKDIAGGTPPLIRGVDYVPDSEEEDLVAGEDIAGGTSLIRGVNYAPDSEEEDWVDDGGVATKPSEVVQVDESQGEFKDENLPWEDEEEARALLLLASTPTDVFMDNFCKHKAFRIMGHLLLGNKKVIANS